MGNIELKITWLDWLSVFIIGLSFAVLLSVFGYYLLALSPLDGALFGFVLGFFITAYSLVFITFMNRYLLPNIEKTWWNSIAAFFSFQAGFLGTLSTHSLLQLSHVKTIVLFATHPIQSSAIIGVLTYLMGALIYRFVKTRNEKEQIDSLFIQSRVRSLETQLNPHFLYNALNSLAELIHQDPLKAEETVLKISTFLRNTMQEKPLITLDQELNNVQSYIDLENIRFHSSIHLEIALEEKTRSMMVPKFSIQLLCENAIKHGMRGGPSPFRISVDARNEASKLIINVSNDGRPIISTHFGIGLSNLQERLSHLCEGNVAMLRKDPPTYQITLKEMYEHSHR